jgi:hypothetical protein
MSSKKFEVSVFNFKLVKNYLKCRMLERFVCLKTVRRSQDKLCSSFQLTVSVLKVSNQIFSMFYSLFTFLLVLVWCINAGLLGELDITRTRYLCEKHFSPNYISNQARRKMLVHTAIPAKWKQDIDAEKVPVNVVGEAPSKKRKMREYHYNEHSFKPKKFVKVEKVSSEKHTLINKVPAVTSSVDVDEIEAEEDDEITLHKQSDTETYEIEEIPKQQPQVHARIVTDSTRNQMYKEITIQPQMRGKKMQYIVVKPKGKFSSSPVKTSPSKQPEPADVEPEEKPQHVYIVEEADTSDPSLEDIFEAKPTEKVEEPMQANVSSEPLEGYSEFIFSGERFVQMPKRVFEAEKEKIRKQAETYRNLLCKLKKCLNRLDLEVEPEKY